MIASCDADGFLGRVFPGDSEMAQRMRELDWSRTEIGDPAGWPESLRTAVSIALSSRFPIFVWWGAGMTMLYNDAYISVLGPNKHPQWLGRPAPECWSEIWGTVGPMIEGVYREGRATWSEELLLVMDRHLPHEETYFTFSYSPILTGDGSRVGGVFCACTETTDYVVRRRRLGTLRELTRRTAKVQAAEHAFGRAAEVLEENAHDIAFAGLYLVEVGKGEACLAASVRADGAFPERVRLDRDRSGLWPIGLAWRTHRHHDVRLDRRAELGGGVWPEHPECAVVLPIVAPGLETTGGVLVVGTSPRRPVDGECREWLGSIAAQIGSAVAEAHAFETERKRAESLAEIDRAKTAFFSNVSHEFRTPLTLMLGPLEDVLGSHSLAVEHRQPLAIAHRNSLRLLRLVNTLLDFSRIEAGRAEAVYEPVDAAQLTADLASSFRAAIERAGVRFDVRCEPARSAVFLDREMWEKIVLNLLSNALKFTLAGTIELRLAESSGNLELVVADTGIGIPQDEMPHVFERFHRVRSAAGRTHEGSGIGLALVSELVRLHGGSVSVRSELGSGSTFTVRVPVGSSHLPADRIGSPRALPSTAIGTAPFVEEALRWLPGSDPARLPEETLPVTAAVATSGARLLVADDNADMRGYLRRLLEPYWQVELANDGGDALERIRRHRPDLLLADIMMPGTDGIALVRELRRDRELRSLPVILLSARAGEESRVEGLAAGADDYLTKPFSARELVARIDAHLEMARVRRQAALEREHLIARESAALRQAELQHEHLRALFLQAPAPVCVLLGPQHRIELANDSICEVWGRPRDEVQGRPLLEAVPELDGQGFADLLDGVYSAGMPHVGRETPCRLRRADGALETRFFNFVYAPMHGVHQDVEGVLVMAFDVTETVRAREETDKLRREAEQANTAKDEFLAVLSHELRSPMNAMLGWLRILKAAGARDPDLVQRATETIERNVWVQAQVVNDLLDVSRIISGKLQLEHERVDVASVVTGCVESLRPSAEGKQIALRLVLRREDLEVMGDGNRLQQVVANLVGNAVKFTDSGGFVTVTVDRDNGHVRLDVEDSGHGIEPDFLPHLFERFRQADSTTARKYGGLGLGLAIVKNVVELHGGRVEAASEGPGRGARFTVWLPLAATRTVPAHPQRTRAATAVARPLDVLLVEDDDDSREALELAFGDHGLTIRSVRSVRQALDEYEQRPPDVLVSDIGMPDGDGYLLIRRIREREEGRSRRTLAIAITGFAAKQDREMALRAGFDDHVGKPVEPELLLERVRALETTRDDARPSPRLPGRAST